MALQWVTLTGVDEHTDLNHLVRLNTHYPYVEWGVLYSDRHAGNHPRYPDLGTILAFMKNRQRCPNPPRAALHVCGSAVFDVAHGTGPVMNVVADFDRIQLNVNAGTLNAHERGKLASGIARLSQHRPVVVQYNEANADWISELDQRLSDDDHHRVDVLVDASCGTGVGPDAWPSPHPTFFTGYAGGLGPANVACEQDRIQTVAESQPFWLDMESSLRDGEDRFDLNRCEQVLSTLFSPVNNREPEPGCTPG